MLIIILSQSTHRILKEGFMHLRHVISHEYQLIVKMNNLAFSNIQICTKMAFDRIKQQAFAHKYEEKYVKNIIVLLARL